MAWVRHGRSGRSRRPTAPAAQAARSLCRGEASAQRGIVRATLRTPRTTLRSDQIARALRTITTRTAAEKSLHQSSQEHAQSFRRRVPKYRIAPSNSVIGTCATSAINSGAPPTCRLSNVQAFQRAGFPTCRLLRRGLPLTFRQRVSWTFPRERPSK
jgi:hypothetical protein